MRVLVFALLGPPLGVLALMLVIAPLVAGEWPYAINPLGPILALLPPAYLLGIVPALIAGLVDLLAARAGLRSWARLMVTATAGFALSFIPIAVAIIAGFMHGWQVALFGFTGPAAAGVCSGLVSWLEARRRSVKA